MDKKILESQFQILCSRLIKEQNSDKFWSGMLSSSALSTAVAIVALKINGNNNENEQIRKGYNWLSANINTDGGFGDTPQSESNVSTSLLCYAAVYYCQPDNSSGNLILQKIEHFLETKSISFSAQNITTSILTFYGKDFTFSIPILSMLTLCGVLPDEAYKRIPQLPFELSLLPASLYRFFNLQVVSYAIPALIGVGIFIHSKRNTRVSFTKLYRNLFVDKAIKKLATLMPESGGFLEAIPLTGFVCMSLIASGKGKNEVVRNGILFLQKQQRRDGSWPIDTDLSTWVTTLSIKALGSQLATVVGRDNQQQLKKHILSIQYKEKHPFNGAKPGGWGWTNYSGSVPDADDTPGAILALLEMYEGTKEEINAIVNGCNWLVDLQNSDGGFPTFCKGWGRLPFDSSCADLTGHALLAMFSSIDKLKDNLSLPLHRKFYRCALKAVDYLQKHQAIDGHWLPLWFGNQLTDDKKNPVYGTAKVCSYLEDCLLNNSVSGDVRVKLENMATLAQNFLLSQQNTDGSWGGKKETSGSIEETALAICALAKNHKEVCIKGFEWLTKERQYEILNSSPIGLYFAALWYDEKMYPLIYYIEALRRFLYD
jgi:squalene-hopene/tetraprenyl-beta-curcumene cyclase